MAHLTSLLGGPDGLLVELRTRDRSQESRQRLWTDIVKYAFDRLSPETALLQMKELSVSTPEVGQAVAVLASHALEPAEVRGMRGARLRELTSELHEALIIAGPHLKAVSLLNGSCEVAGVSDFGDTMSVLSTEDAWPGLAASLALESAIASMTGIDLNRCE
jgi:hypothetical protein